MASMILPFLSLPLLTCSAYQGEVWSARGESPYTGRVTRSNASTICSGLGEHGRADGVERAGVAGEHAGDERLIGVLGQGEDRVDGVLVDEIGVAAVLRHWVRSLRMVAEIGRAS